MQRAAINCVSNLSAPFLNGDMHRSLTEITFDDAMRAANCETDGQTDGSTYVSLSPPIPVIRLSPIDRQWPIRRRVSPGKDLSRPSIVHIMG